MDTIIDTPVNVAAYAQTLAEAGVRTVIRYYCRSSSIAGKCLTKAEADALLAAGLSIAVVFQQRGGAGGHVEDLDAESGSRDARSALDLAEIVGQPQGSAIYFAVDHDFRRAADLASIAAYFAVVRTELAGRYRIGVYGSGVVADAARSAGAGLVWLAGATGWGGTKDALGDGRYHLFQHRMNLRSDLGFAYDGNAALVADFGQWPGPSGQPQPMVRPSRNDVRAVQRACEAAGTRPGPIDGIAGPLTRAAVARLRVLLDALG